MIQKIHSRFQKFKRATLNDDTKIDKAATATKRTTAAPDRSRINIEVDQEVRYWAKHFRVSKEQLEAAVEKVGNNAATVRKELGLGAQGRLGVQGRVGAQGNGT